jgi:hypothetical protein
LECNSSEDSCGRSLSISTVQIKPSAVPWA